MKGIAAAGNDCYLIATSGTSDGNGGLYDSHPSVWKNGALQSLPMGNCSYGGLGGIFVTGQ